MIATTLLLSALLGAPAPATVVARVDATEITQADVAERVRATAAARRARTARQAVSELVDEAVLAAEARRQKLDADPEVRAAIEAERRRLALEALVASLTEKYEPPEETLREMYHSTGDSLRLVLVKVESEAAALAVLERVRKGGELGAEAAAGLDRALAATRGDTGLVIRAALPKAVADAAFRAKPGDLVGPIALPLGFAIARVVTLQAGDEKGFAERRPAVLRHARQQAAAGMRQHLAQQLRAKATVDEAFLKGLGARIDVTPAELERTFATVNGRPLRYRELHPKVLQIARIGHGAAGASRPKLAWAHVETVLLEDEALARGHDRSPSVTGAMPGIERNLLAGALTRKLGGDAKGGALKGRLDALRAAAKITVDEARVAALEQAR